MKLNLKVLNLPRFKYQTYGLYELSYLLSLIDYFKSSSSFKDMSKFNLNDRTLIESMFKKDQHRFNLLRKKFDLSLAWKLSLKLKIKNLQLKQELTRELRYPIFLYIIGLLLFFSLSFVILPTFKSTLPQIELPNYSTYLQFWLGFQLGLVGLISLFFVSYLHRYDISLFKWLKLKNESNIWLLLNSYHLAYQLTEFLKSPTSFIEALELIKASMHGLSAKLIQECYIDIKSGQTLANAFQNYETLFANIFRLDSDGQETLHQLENYVKFTELRLKHQLHQFKLKFQFFTYLQIGIGVALSYQVFYLPLKILEDTL